MKKMTVGVLVPAYNEEKTIAQILEKLVSLKNINEIIVVNDASKDQTLKQIAKLKSKKIKVFNQKKNQGKTAAIRRAVSESKSDIVIIQDADLEYDPTEIQLVIDPILMGRADVVYGSRFMVRKATRVLYFYHYLANQVLTFCSNMMTNLNMTDIETCYKAFRRPILGYLPLSSHGFGMEVEITALISKMPLRIYEVPISYYGRTYEEGKKIGLKDGLMALWYVLFYNLIAPNQKKYKLYFRQVRKDLHL